MITDPPRPIRLLLIVSAAAVALAFAGGVLVRVVSDNHDAAVKTQALVKRIQREGEERRDQTCKLFEAQHLADVDKLKGTYRYLDQLPRSAYGSNLTKAIVTGLPDLEAAARVDGAPEYCDEPGANAEAHGAKPIGLPEPDPVAPKRRDFSAWLKR